VGTSTDELRRDIERTRRSLTDDLDAIGDRVSPRRMASRRMERSRRWMRSVRTQVFGVADDMGDRAGDMKEQAGEMAHRAGEIVQDAPHMAAERTRGNPGLAGALAFGVGFLIGVGMPASRAERQAVGALADRPEVQQAVGQLTEEAKQAGSALKQAGSEAVQDLKEDVRQHAAEVTEDVKDTTQDTAQKMRS